ncbi:MAG: carbohydrate-binding family 9-like protein [Deltaproteobacteria bacterium]|nr:carbohydrate-binding family 9-like protein [Deltaproteobacteria bacterium]
MKVRLLDISFLLIGIVIFAVGASCKRSPDNSPLAPEVAARLLTRVSPRFPSNASIHERSGRGVVTYLGFDTDPSTIKAGDVVTLTHYFRVDHPFSGDYDVFVHGETSDSADHGAGRRILVADHAPVMGRHPTHLWKAGEIWADPHRVLIPAQAAAPRIEILVGLFKGETRLILEAEPGKNDGYDRLRAGILEIQGVTDDLPEVTVTRLQPGERIEPDGRLDEAVWKNAEVLELSDSMGRRPPPADAPTTLRLLYDDTYLYVAFEAVDPDITERYAQRDDPIYEHEAVEVFLMPNTRAPQIGPYVELQASPGGILFDAAFTGRRQGMDKSFDAGQVVGTQITGTLNQPDVDQRWVSEWRVPWLKIRGVTRPPTPEDEWRMNAFRIDKSRVDGRDTSEYTAWSPPRIGDFHNVARFGRMKFGR